MIHLYGCQTSGNEVADNDVHPATQFMAISLYGVTKTEVVANRVAGTVWLGGSSENRVFNNTIDNTLSPSWIHAGVALAEDLPPCGGAAMIPSTANVVQSNAIIGAHVGVLMAGGSVKNKLMWNKIYGQRAIGIQFFPGSDDNDARSNGYGAPVDVVDLGRGNLWP
jgi:nitrous oxidase accessory protein NosD